jgi:hypothetical protein
MIRTIERNVMGMQIMVSDIHRNMVKRQEVNDRLVSDIHSLSTAELPLTAT